ncbi:BBSome-interacting protein 1 [Myripristis murdjan]|nr:BBSome-interacting protein 1 [Myripristis murdjan]
MGWEARMMSLMLQPCCNGVTLCMDMTTVAHSEDTMPEVKSIFREVLPKQGQLSMEDVPTLVLCKPKLLPLKSVTLEKLEKMQMEAQEAVKQQELASKEPSQ